MRYAVIVKKAEASFGVHALDLSGCVSVVKIKKEELKLIQETTEFRIKGLLEEGRQISNPSSATKCIDVKAA